MMKSIILAAAILLGLAAPSLAQIPSASAPMVPNAPPGTGTGGAVSSVFGRTGAVAAQSGDYNFSQIGGNYTLAQGPTIGANTVLGSIAGGTPIALSQAQLTSLINPATASLPGALPAWPNDATKFFGGDGNYRTALTQITFGNGSSGGVCTTTCTVAVQETINSLTGSNPAILTAAWGSFSNLNNAGAQAPTIAGAGSAGFPAGSFFDIGNTGAGIQTLTPGAGTVGGNATLAFPAGSATVPRFARLISDGVSNYQIAWSTLSFTTGPASSTNGNLPSFNGTTGLALQDSGILATSLAPKASPTFTGVPAAPTASAGDNTTQIATDAFVTTAVANAIAGVNPAIAVKAATTAAGDTSTWVYANGASGIGATFTGPVNTAIVIDGITFTATTQRLLIKNDTQSPSGAFNGVYMLTTLQTGITGAIFTRALDYDTPSDINNTGSIPVVSGTVNVSTSWLLTSSVATVGTDPLTFAQFTLNPTTVVTLTGSQALTNKTITSATDIIGGVTAGFGSDAKGDIYTNGGSSNVVVRLGIGSTGNCLVVASGLPSWGSCGSGSTFLPSTYVTGGTQYYAPISGLVPTTGAALTASTTAYCFFGSVAASVTIKALAGRLSTGVAATNVEYAIYSFANPPTNTLTLVDTSNAQASTATSSTNVQTNLANSTDALSPGILYAWCSASSGAVTFTSFGAMSGGPAVIGSATVTNVVAATGSIIGRSFPVTYSATPSSTFPGTLSLSSGTDIIAGAATLPQLAFLVN